MSLYDFVHQIVACRLLRRAYRIEVVGAERLPATGPVIFAANHDSVFDPFAVGVATTRAIHYMAKAELFRWRPLAYVVRSLNAFPVERGGGDQAAITEAGRLLANGEVIGIFPEGTSKPSRKNGWHRGAARLALSTGVPLVPVRLTGTRRLPLPTRVRIVIGEPIVVPAQRPTIAAARALTERLERAVVGAGAG